MCQNEFSTCLNRPRVFANKASTRRVMPGVFLVIVYPCLVLTGAGLILVNAIPGVALPDRLAAGGVIGYLRRYLRRVDKEIYGI